MSLVLASCSASSDDVTETPSLDASPPVTAPASTTPTSGAPDVEPSLPPDKWELAELWGRIDGSTATIPLTTELYNTITDGEGNWPPAHNKTSRAYRRLIGKDGTDLIFVTYPSEDVLILAERSGVELEVVPVAKDALVFLANAENPVDDVSTAQLRDVYSGIISNWADLGGESESIIPYQRPVNSGSQTLFLELLMGNIQPMEPPNEWLIAEMGTLVESVSYYDNSRYALGYSMFFYVNNMYGNSRFKLLSIDGVYPTRSTITNGQYPLEDYYYAVMRKDTPEDSPARKLVDWLLTDEGQAVAARAGYIPLRPMESIYPDDAIDPIYLGDTENSSGTGGTDPKTSLDDIFLYDGVRRPLSDMFFDGFNYIRYINDCIAADVVRAYPSFEQGSWGEGWQLRPFIGIPNDYPNYEIYSIGALTIAYPTVNPFFNGAAFFSIPLTTDISPYGRSGRSDVTVKYEHIGRVWPGVDLYTLSVEIRDNPDVTVRINEQLEAWITAFPEDCEYIDLFNAFLDGQAGKWPSGYDWGYMFKPMFGFWGDYLSISYLIQTYDGPEFGSPMVYTICFDINTGESADLVAVLSEFYSRTDFWISNKPLEYIPAADSVITAAWLLQDGFNSAIQVYITEPDGQLLIASIGYR